MLPITHFFPFFFFLSYFPHTSHGWYHVHRVSAWVITCVLLHLCARIYTHYIWCTVFSSSAFDGLLQLLKLDLSMNQIQNIPSDALIGLVSLRSLDLSYNQLKKLDNRTNGVLDDCLSLERVGSLNFIQRVEEKIPLNKEKKNSLRIKTRNSLKLERKVLGVEKTSWIFKNQYRPLWNNFFILPQFSIRSISATTPSVW